MERECSTRALESDKTGFKSELVEVAKHTGEQGTVDSY